MISLKQSIDEDERRAALLTTAVNCFGDALIATSRHLSPVYEGKLNSPPPSFDAELTQIRNPDTIRLVHAAKKLDLVLHDFQQRLMVQVLGSGEVHEMLERVGRVTTQLRQRTTKTQSDLAGLASSLDSTARMTNINDLRRALTKGIEDLVQLAASIHQENLELVDAFEQEMSIYRRKLDEATRGPDVPGREGDLGGRNELARHMAAPRHPQEVRCLILFDLIHFGRINDKHGPFTGDELLRAFCRRIKDHLKDTEEAFRGTGAQFMIFTPLSLRDAMARGRQLERVLRGTYELRSATAGVVIQLELALGVLEVRQGESLDQLLQRVSALLPQNAA